MLPDKAPRQYAQDIMQMKTQAERIEALKAVPAHLQSWVREYVEASYRRQRGKL